MSDWFRRHAAPYKSLHRDLRALAEDLRAAVELFPAGTSELCREVEHRLRTLGDDLAAPRFRLPFAGGFSGGKSHTICALLERPGLLPSASRATTGNATELVFAREADEEAVAEICYFDREKLARCLESYGGECARIFKHQPHLVADVQERLRRLCAALRGPEGEPLGERCEPVFAFAAGHIADYGLETRERQVLYNLADLLCAFLHERELVRRSAKVRRVPREAIADYAAKRDYPWVQDAPRDADDLREALRLKYLTYHLDGTQHPKSPQLGPELRLGEARAPAAGPLAEKLRAAQAQFAEAERKRDPGFDLGEALEEYRRRLSFLLIWKVVLPVESELLRHGASIIDLPGADAPFPRDEFVARLFLGEADGAVVLSSCLKPLSETDAEVVSILEKVREVDLDKKTFFVFNQYGKLDGNQRPGLGTDLDASLRVIKNRARIAAPAVFLTDALVGGHLSSLASATALRRACLAQSGEELRLADASLPGPVAEAFVAADPALERHCDTLLAAVEGPGKEWLERLCQDLREYRAKPRPALGGNRDGWIEAVERDGGIGRLREAIGGFLAEEAARARLAEIRANLGALLERLEGGLQGPGEEARQALAARAERSQHALVGELRARFQAAREALEEAAERPDGRLFEALWSCREELAGAIAAALDETDSRARSSGDDADARRDRVFTAALDRLEARCEERLLAALEDGEDPAWQQVEEGVLAPLAPVGALTPLLDDLRATRPTPLAPLAKLRHKRAWARYRGSEPLPRRRLRGWSRLLGARLERELLPCFARLLGDVADAVAWELAADRAWQYREAARRLAEIEALAAPWLAEHRPPLALAEPEAGDDPELRRWRTCADLYGRALELRERFAEQSAEG